ncbi:MAG: hypothetical protein IIC52_12230 [Proteobacteria bacterium]|nr:hypothetical protein [Pseudomonadota bacterium]
MQTNPPKFDLAHAIADDLATRQGTGQTMSDALHVLSAISMAGLAVVPREPTAEMLTAGALAAGISTPILYKAWQAILAAAQ